MRDPTLGRFIQPDSIVPDPASAKGFDRYSYVNNNPVNFNDPSGHGPCDGEIRGRSSEMHWPGDGQSDSEDDEQETSQRGYEFLITEELFKPFPYNDQGDDSPDSNCTIEYGTLLHTGRCGSEDFEKYQNGISKQQAWLWMIDFVQTKIEPIIRQKILIALTQYQFYALVSFLYNGGPNKIKLLLPYFNEFKNIEWAANYMESFVNNNKGHYLYILEVRRKREARLMLVGDYGSLPWTIPAQKME